MTEQTLSVNELDTANTWRNIIEKQGMTTNGEIARAARDLIRTSPYQRGFRAVSCSEHDGILLLHGRVHSFFEKQQVQEAVRGVPAA